MDAATLDGIAGRGIMVEMPSGPFRETRGEFHYNRDDAAAVNDIWQRGGLVEYVGPVQRIGGRVERMKLKVFIKRLGPGTLAADLTGSGAPVPAGDLEAE